MSDYLRQQLVEATQATESYYTARIAELNAEVKRLRTNITGLQTYAKERAAKYEAAADGPVMRGYFRGKAETYADMERMACVAYCGEIEPEATADDAL